MHRPGRKAEVARQVGTHCQSVSQWATQLREMGRKGLRKAGRASRKPGRPEDRKQIDRRLKRGPEVLGYGHAAVDRIFRHFVSTRDARFKRRRHMQEASSLHTDIMREDGLLERRAAWIVDGRQESFCNPLQAIYSL
jgi:hypothetical protein